MKKLHIALILLMVLILLAPVQAGNLTIAMSNPGNIMTRDIVVYFPNGTMYGYYNDTSVIDLDTNSSYLFTLKPLSTNPLEDPGEWLTATAFPFIQTNVVPIIIILFVVGLLVRRR